jgi:hypothetical protein
MEPIYHLNWDDARILIVKGVRENGAIRVREDQRGIVIYGPYVPVPSGTYRATLKLLPPCRGTAVMDVCTNTGGQILGRKIVSAEHDIAEGGTTIEFCVQEAASDLEVRLSSSGGFAAQIGGLEIVGQPNDVIDRFSLSQLPEVAIDAAPSRGRSLYDGYRRGVGLQFYGATQKILYDPDFREARELAGSRTILSDSNLCNLFLIVKFYLPRLPAGHIVEFGSYRGGSAIFMAALTRKFLPECKVLGFDTFAGMPATDQRVDHHRAGSFADVDLAELRNYSATIGLDQHLEFVQGNFADTAMPTMRDIGPVVLAHIDCDIRSAIQCAYDATRPYMVSGGYWILDDPQVSDCLGAAEAMEDLFIRRDCLNSEQVYPHYVFRQP